MAEGQFLFVLVYSVVVVLMSCCVTAGEISLQAKGYLKDLIVDQDKSILSVAEAFDAENDIHDVRFCFFLFVCLCVVFVVQGKSDRLGRESWRSRLDSIQSEFECHVCLFV